MSLRCADFPLTASSFLFVHCGHGSHTAIVHRSVHHNQTLDRTFFALSDPTRRSILERLAHGPATIGELAEPFGLTLNGLKKHAGFPPMRGMREATRPLSAVTPQTPLAEAEQASRDRSRALSTPDRVAGSQHTICARRHLTTDRDVRHLGQRCCVLHQLVRRGRRTAWTGPDPTGLIASRNTVVMDSTDAVDPGFARLVEEQAALR